MAIKVSTLICISGENLTLKDKFLNDLGFIYTTVIKIIFQNQGVKIEFIAAYSCHGCTKSF